jgi:hypothetical protein
MRKPPISRKPCKAKTNKVLSSTRVWQAVSRESWRQRGRIYFLVLSGGPESNQPHLEMQEIRDRRGIIVCSTEGAQRRASKLKFLVTTENADIAFDHGNFPDYHRWYVGSWDREKSISEYVDGFPCIISDGEDVFDDGWHRFHAYVSRGNLTTPCLLLRHKLRPESAA